MIPNLVADQHQHNTRQSQNMERRNCLICTLFHIIISNKKKQAFSEINISYEKLQEEADYKNCSKVEKSQAKGIRNCLKEIRKCFKCLLG